MEFYLYLCTVVIEFLTIVNNTDRYYIDIDFLIFYYLFLTIIVYLGIDIDVLRTSYTCRYSSE